MAKGTISDLRGNLRTARQAMEAQLSQLALRMANDTKVLAQRSIMEKGFGQEYSTKEVPAFWLMGRELNKKGEAYLKRQQKKGEGANWKGLRDAQGLPTDHVDLSYTGNMWRGLTVVAVKKGGKYVYVAEIGGRTSEAQDKMDWNYERYGDFIQYSLGKQYQRVLAKIFEQKLITILKQYI